MLIEFWLDPLALAGARCRRLFVKMGNVKRKKERRGRGAPRGVFLLVVVAG